MKSLLVALASSLVAATLLACSDGSSSGSLQPPGPPGGGSAASGGGPGGPGGAGGPGGPGGAGGSGPAAGAGGTVAGCDVWAVFENNTCTSCHKSTNPAGGLNLVDQVEARKKLLEGKSQNGPCSRSYVDLDNPSQSLLLEMLDASRYNQATTCAPLMPPGGSGLSASDLACVESWIAAQKPATPPPSAFTATDPLTYARKVKTLVNGAAVTDAELAQLEANPDSFRAMIAGWMDMPWTSAPAGTFAQTVFEAKLGQLLMREFQQNISGGFTQIVDRYRSGTGRPLREPRLLTSLQESSERTLIELVRDGKKLTEAMTTSEWYVNTAVLAYITYFEQTEAERNQTFKVFLHQPGFYFSAANEKMIDGKEHVHDEIAFGGKTYVFNDLAQPIRANLEAKGFKGKTVQSSPAERTWLWNEVSSDTILEEMVDGAEDKDGANDGQMRCIAGDLKTKGYIELTSRRMFDLLFGTVDCGPTKDKHPSEGNAKLITEAEFNDWRKVTFVDGNTAPRFYDLKTLRSIKAGDSITLRRPKRGFFSTEAFLTAWLSNKDNSLRVTANQALIAALGQAIIQSDTTPLSVPTDPADDHTQSSQSCKNCHRTLDPMRNLLLRAYSPQSYFPSSGTLPKGEFGFLGHKVADDPQGFASFAKGLASHPGLASAWVQKMCLYANSRVCDEEDEVFKGIVQKFSTHLNLRELLLDLLSSPLVTSATQTSSYTQEPLFTSITRREHLCFALSSRLGKDLCGLPALRTLLESIPNDTIARGERFVQQATQNSAFHTRTMSRFCEKVATVAVTGDPATSYFYKNGAEPDLDTLVSGLLSVPASSPRHATLRTALQQHFDQAKAKTTPLTAARSTFVTACMSPELTGLGF